MAAEGLASYVQKIDDITECAICTQAYNKPKILPCVHTFCLDCLEAYTQKIPPEGIMNCPLCRKSCQIPPGGVEQFPGNFFMEQLQELRGNSGQQTDDCVSSISFADEESESLSEISSKFISENVSKSCVANTTLDLMSPAQMLQSGQPIWGVCTLFDEIFLVREGAQEVEVYDAETFKPKHPLSVDGLIYPNDMTSCGQYRCLYISDAGTAKYIHRVELGGNRTRWRLNENPHGLSVTRDDSNVIVTFNDPPTIREYTTSGVQLREIRLQSDVINPFHAIQLKTGQFLICHGVGRDRLHRVCVVNADGAVYRSYGGPAGSGIGQMDGALRLAVDQNEFIFAADVKNKRILLFNDSSLVRAKVLISGRGSNSKSDLKTRCQPRRMCFDSSRKRVYIAMNYYNDTSYTSGEAFVYNIKYL